MDEKEIICNKLLKTKSLYEKSEALRHHLASFGSTEASNRRALLDNSNARNRKIVEDGKNRMAKRPRLPACTGSMPVPPDKPLFSSQIQIIACAVLGLLTYAMLIFSIIFAFLVAVNVFEDPEPYFGPMRTFFLLFIVGLVLWGFVGKKVAYNAEYYEKNEQYKIKADLWENEFEASIGYITGNGFVNDYRKFDESFINFVKTTEESLKYSFAQYGRDKSDLATNSASDKARLNAEYEATLKELSSINVVVPEYYKYAGRFYDALRCGRADSLKEAINIVLNDVRLEEEESARRAEAARQAEILQRQADEARRHNAEMERAANEQARAAEKSYDEAARHNREMEKNAYNQQNKRYSNDICLRCANYAGKGGSCNGEFVKRTGTCGSFRS